MIETFIKTESLSVNTPSIKLLMCFMGLAVFAPNLYLEIPEVVFQLLN
ncbi:hypothetical protein [Gelidibacter sp.]|nr:hypothetical protein [Gelidibacter sp.]HUH27302.1 hypothetical protein [Gelidibacter sp.]